MEEKTAVRKTTEWRKKTAVRKKKVGGEDCSMGVKD